MKNKWDFGIAPNIIQAMINKSSDEDEKLYLGRVLRVFELLKLDVVTKESDNASSDT